MSYVSVFLSPPTDLPFEKAIPNQKRFRPFDIFFRCHGASVHFSLFCFTHRTERTGFVVKIVLIMNNNKMDFIFYLLKSFMEINLISE